MGKETASKAWGAAVSGALIALLTVISNSLETGGLDPVALDALGGALGSLAEVVISSGLAYAVVWFTPRNKPVDE